MKVEDLFSQLSYGELSNLAMGMEGAGTIAASAQGRVIALANAALTTLHSRFVLRKAVIELITEEGAKSYTIPADPDQGGEIIKILAVERQDDPTTLTVDESASISFTRRTLPTGCVVISHNTLRFDEPKDGVRYLVECQVGPELLTMPADLDQSVSIIPTLEEALLMRIAASVYSGMGGVEHSAKGVEFLQRFEQLCALAKDGDFAQETATEEDNRFRDGGFV